MTWGLAGAFAAAVAYGAATVLQAVGARRTARSEAPGARLLWQLLQSLPYVLGLLLDGVGFALSLAALRSQPLFTVQAIVASSLAFTALLAVIFLRTRLIPLEWIAVAIVIAGLVLLGLSATNQPPAHVSLGGRLLLLGGVAAVGVVVATRAAVRADTGRNDVWALGCLAGLMYGAGGIGARILARPRSVGGLLLDPALWAMLIAGVLGLLLYAMALQRGSVTVATSAVVVTETLAPAALGITLLGDRPAHGRATVAAVGFALAVLGSVILARYGEAPVRSESQAEPVVSDLAGRTG